MLASFFEILFAEYFRYTLIALFLLSVLSALLSPLIVLSRRSFVPDALGHLVLPGVVVGILLSEFTQFNKWIIVFITCFIVGSIGLKSQFILERRLKLASDSSSVVLLGLFFSFGVLLSKVSNTSVDLHSILFGDPLGADFSQLMILSCVVLFTLLGIFWLRKDISAWLCDREFSLVSGYRIRNVELLFTLAVTSSVLIGIWTVGSLMVTAFLTLPQIISANSKVLALQTLAVSITLCLIGVSFSILWNLPLGATCVFAGSTVVILKSIFAHK
jgi:ABC-type Mn2+/Zn2+ transport system permease subunit